MSRWSDIGVWSGKSKWRFRTVVSLGLLISVPLAVLGIVCDGLLEFGRGIVVAVTDALLTVLNESRELVEVVRVALLAIKSGGRE